MQYNLFFDVRMWWISNPGKPLSNVGVWSNSTCWARDMIIFVTSRSGTLRKLILWGHLLASDLDYYTIGCLIMIMRYYGYDDMLFCCIYIDMCYWMGSPECVGNWTSRMKRHRSKPLGLWIELGSGLLGFDCCWYDICSYDYMLWWIIIIIDMIHWWMEDDDSLSVRFTYGVERSRTKTKYSEGEVGKTALP